MNKPLFVAACAVILIGASNEAWAARIVPISQSRTLMGDSNANHFPQSQQDIQQAAAGDFQSFDDQLTTLASLPGASASSQMTLSSTLEACSINASAHMTGTAQAAEGAMAYSVGSILHSIQFILTQDVPFHLGGHIEADALSNVQVRLQFNGSFIVDQTVVGESRDLSFSGAMGPGTYTLVWATTGVPATLQGGRQSAASSFDLTFSICFHPADYDTDGDVDGLDLGMLLSQWDYPDGGTVDLNGDHVVNGVDLGILLSAWTF